MNKPDNMETAIARMLELGAEVESAGEATTDEDAVAQARAVLHAWVDTVAGVVVNAGLGRVTLIHTDGRESGISSNLLPYQLSRPVRFNKA